MIILLIIIGIIVVGYFTVEKVDIAGTYQAEDSISKHDYDLTAEISNQGQTTLTEIDCHYFMTTELTFDELEISYNFTQGDDNETVIIKGHLTHEELDMLRFNLKNLPTTQTTTGITINNRTFISQ